VLPPFIIDQIRKREQEVRERPVLQIYIEEVPDPELEPSPPAERGITIIDFNL
jgi:hypothetical protein